MHTRTVQPIRSQSDRENLARYFREHNLRDYALFMTGIYTGRRISDLVRLKNSDVMKIDSRGRYVIRTRLIVFERKTKKFIDLLIHPALRRVLSKYLKLRRRCVQGLKWQNFMSDYLFPSHKRGSDGEYRIRERQAWRILNKAARECELTYKIGTHSLRKTFGYMLYRNGISIEVIQKLLNHSSPEITLAYIGITRDDMDEAILSMD